MLHTIFKGQSSLREVQSAACTLTSRSLIIQSKAVKKSVVLQIFFGEGSVKFTSSFSVLTVRIAQVLTFTHYIVVLQPTHPAPLAYLDRQSRWS